MEGSQSLRDKLAAFEAERAALYASLKQKNRELEIEAALEKVRERTLTMRNSTELSEASAVLFQQLKELDIHTIRTGVGIFDEPNEAMELWVTSESGSQGVIKIQDYFSLHIHPVFENIIPARRRQETFALTILRGEEVRRYYQTMSTYLSQPGNQQYLGEEFFYSFFFMQGALNVVTDRPLEAEECRILERFARAFGLIYTRFQDLQKAEVQTKDALQQTSLNRVRAEIASMRTADDLQRITPLIWEELVALGVPFFRCGIFIVSEAEKLVHAYLSTPGGQSLGVLHLRFDGDDITRALVDSWRQKKVYTDSWSREQFQSWVQYMLEAGQITETKQYQAGENAPDSLCLQFMPFTQGMLYVGSHMPLEYWETDLLHSLADSFSVAYARYEDFKQLDLAKNRIEATLTELRATQSQLIQAEKMASLGALTAGIAHEIQNPLNFVNNFSEINRDLIEELRGERRKAEGVRDTRLEEELLNDIAQNEEKITHHGKRADAIVKNMLQHSRSSSGQKEPTDINALCDEYLRLSYHGLRAKDSSFQANMEVSFDDSIGKVNVVPQDLGRVLLNLINNAFYSCTERSAQRKAGSQEPGAQSNADKDRNAVTEREGLTANSYQLTASPYEPKVSITTKKTGNFVEIRVADNGNGIPQKVLDKIFQPFFTTKPTGVGTGLGLSLSYDIVKAHGGEIRVETKEGEGTEFIVELPV